MNIFRGAELTETEAHKNLILSRLKDVYKEVQGSSIEDWKVRVIIETLIDMADHVYDHQIEKEQQYRQIQAAEDIEEEGM